MSSLLHELHHKQTGVDDTRSGAIFDVSGRYRYSLWRIWSADHPRLLFIMLNPSTAGEQKNDPTIRRCIEFAHSWRFGSLEVVNLFAFRATDARELLKVDDPVGKENDRYLVQAIGRCATVVVSWGTKGTLLGRDRQVMQLFAGMQHVHCLGITREGHPRHPLYVKGDSCLMPFRVPLCLSEPP